MPMLKAKFIIPLENLSDDHQVHHERPKSSTFVLARLQQRMRFRKFAKKLRDERKKKIFEKNKKKIQQVKSINNSQINDRSTQRKKIRRSRCELLQSNGVNSLITSPNSRKLRNRVLVNPFQYNSLLTNKKNRKYLLRDKSSVEKKSTMVSESESEEFPEKSLGKFSEKSCKNLSSKRKPDRRTKKKD